MAPNVSKGSVLMITKRLQLQHQLSLNMHFIHPPYDMITWHNAPLTCGKGVFRHAHMLTADGRQARVKGAMILASVKCACYWEGNVAVLPTARLKTMQNRYDVW